jgi:hypothetical protein
VSGGDRTEWEAPVKALFDEAVARAKREVLEDVRTGRVPRDVKDFSELHDHVDANEYGGGCEEGGPACLFRVQRLVGEDAAADFFNELQDELDGWIKGGGLR